ncbi:Phage I-like protein [Gammaproteobacteria bacterium]
MPKAAPDAHSLTLCAFRAVALDASGGSPFPRRLVICPTGSSDARSRGKIIVNADTFAGLTERQNQMKLGMRLALDAEHCTVEGTPAYLADKEPRAVLAWATLGGSLAEGLVYEDIEPTPLGLEAWKNNQYQDVSPAVFRREDGTVIGVHSTAFCRHGELDGLTISAAAAGKSLAPFFAALSATTNPPAKPMKPTAELIALLAALGVTLAADADEATTTAALKSATMKVGEDAKEPAEPAAMTAIQTQLTTLSAQMKAVTDERDEMKRDALVARAGNEGKVLPLSAEMIKLTPLNVLEEMVNKAIPGVVPLGRKTVTTEKQGEKPDTLSAEGLAVFTKMGLTEEDFKKYGTESKPETAAA